MPDVRQTLARPDGELRIQIAQDGAGTGVVQIVRSWSGGKLIGVTIKPDELDGIVETLFRCRCLLLGTPDRNATSIEVQRRAGLIKDPPAGKKRWRGR